MKDANCKNVHLSFVQIILFFVNYWSKSLKNGVCSKKTIHYIAKPIFHWKLRLRRLPKANEINTKNIKCTCPKPGTQRNLYSTGWGFASGETQISAFSDTNMLVSPTQNSGVGGLSQRQGPTQLFLRRSGIYALVCLRWISRTPYSLFFLGAGDDEAVPEGGEHREDGPGVRLGHDPG